MSSITRVVFQLFATNVTRIALNVAMCKHVFFKTIGCEKAFATKFTHMLAATLLFIVFTSFVAGQRGQRGRSVYTLITGVRFFTGVASFMFCQAGTG